MYMDLIMLLIWNGMKKDVVDYVARFLECQQVNAKHQHPLGLLQPHTTPKFKWKVILMDFIVGLSMTSRRHDLILVMVYILIKSAHFIPVKNTYQALEIRRVLQMR